MAASLLYLLSDIDQLHLPESFHDLGPSWIVYLREPLVKQLPFAFCNLAKTLLLNDLQFA